MLWQPVQKQSRRLIVTLMVLLFCTAGMAQASATPEAPSARTPIAGPRADSSRLFLPQIFGARWTDPTQPVILPIDGLQYPNGLAVHQGQNWLFITSRDNNRLLKVDAHTGQVLDSADTGSQPWGVAVNEGTGRVYVSNFGGEVWVYTVDDLEVIARIDVGEGPGQMAILPQIDTVAVVVTGENRVVIVEGLELGASLDSQGGGSYGIAADPANNHLVVTHRDSGTARLLLRTGEGWINTGAEIRFQHRVVPFSVACDYRRSRLYFVIWHPDGRWYVEVFTKLSSSSVTVGAKIPVNSSGDLNDLGVGGAGLAVNVNNGHVFNANTADNSVTVIDGKTDRVAATVAAETDPFAVAVNLNTGHVFVALRAANQILRFPDNYE